MIDLKIAEALGIPVFISQEGWARAEWPYPYIMSFPHGDNSADYIFEPKAKNGRLINSHDWSLTGPDAGNTMLVITQELINARYVVEISADPDTLEVIIMNRNGRVFISKNKAVALALREAAAKALKVEVEG